MKSKQRISHSSGKRSINRRGGFSPKISALIRRGRRPFVHIPARQSALRDKSAPAELGTKLMAPCLNNLISGRLHNHKRKRAAKKSRNIIALGARFIDFTQSHFDVASTQQTSSHFSLHRRIWNWKKVKNREKKRACGASWRFSREVSTVWHPAGREMCVVFSFCVEKWLRVG